MGAVANGVMRTAAEVSGGLTFNRHGDGGTCGHQRHGTYTSGTSRSEEALDDLAVLPSEMLKADRRRMIRHESCLSRAREEGTWKVLLS